MRTFLCFPNVHLGNLGFLAYTRLKLRKTLPKLFEEPGNIQKFKKI